jgi:hypothetical protein
MSLRPRADDNGGESRFRTNFGVVLYSRSLAEPGYLDLLFEDGPPLRDEANDSLAMADKKSGLQSNSLLSKK